ncbi:MAG TPA: hypothetical protein EYG85_05885 [Crocinitomix sp.]|nr:hypothetical protein [Crocinitomix sp.]
MSIIRVIAKFKHQISISLLSNDDILNQKDVNFRKNVDDNYLNIKNRLDKLNIGFKSFQPLIDPIQFLSTNTNKINSPSNITNVHPFSKVFNFINLSELEEKRRIEISEYLELDKTKVLEFEGGKSILEIIEVLIKEEEIIESLEIDYLTQQYKVKETKQKLEKSLNKNKKLHSKMNTILPILAIITLLLGVVFILYKK